MVQPTRRVAVAVDHSALAPGAQLRYDDHARMSFKPFNWNVVVLGAWNRAIFTPAWISQSIFELPDGTPVAIEVPLNVQGPWRVKHEGIGVVVAGGSLEIAADSCGFAQLELARVSAKRALAALPRTPVRAAGVNVRYKADEVPPELAAALECALDSCLTSASLNIASRQVLRSLNFEGGLINLTISIHPAEGSVVQFNFHRDAIDANVLTSWLDIPIDKLIATVQTVMDGLPGVTDYEN